MVARDDQINYICYRQDAQPLFRTVTTKDVVVVVAIQGCINKRKKIWMEAARAAPHIIHRVHKIRRFDASELMHRETLRVRFRQPLIQKFALKSVGERQSLIYGVTWD